MGAEINAWLGFRHVMYEADLMSQCNIKQTWSHQGPNKSSRSLHEVGSKVKETEIEIEWGKITEKQQSRGVLVRKGQPLTSGSKDLVPIKRME